MIKFSQADEEYIDTLAEHISQFWRSPEGALRIAAKKSSLEDCMLSAESGAGHTAAVAKALAASGDSAGRAINQPAEWRDTGTADLFTRISGGIEKSLWFVKAHQQADQ